MAIRAGNSYFRAPVGTGGRPILAAWPSRLRRSASRCARSPGDRRSLTGSSSTGSGSRGTTTRATRSCCLGSSGSTRCSSCARRGASRAGCSTGRCGPPAPVRHTVLLGAASRRYRYMFTAENEQIAYFSGRIVSDVDDPVFTPREVELLNRPNLAAYVVTAESAARRFESLGVSKPWHVIPQGVPLAALTEDARMDVAQRTAATASSSSATWPRSSSRATTRRRQRALQRRPPARAVAGDRGARPGGAALAARRGERPRP